MERLPKLEKRRGGRPPKKIKKDCIVMVRLTKSEHFIIDGKAKKSGMKISEWFRQAAKSATILTRLSAEDLRTLRMLAGLANNLNQLTKLSHEHGLLIFLKRCRETIDGIDSLMRKLFGE